MKLSEYKNEDALNLLADILEPVTVILADKDIANMMNNGTPKIKIITTALKSYSKEIIEILATVEGVPVSEYSGTIITMTASLLEILNDEGLADFFTSREPRKAEKSSMSVMVNTKAKEK